MLPRIASVPPLLSVGRSGSSRPSRADVLGEWTMGGKEALGMPGRLEARHAPFPTRWISRIASTRDSQALNTFKDRFHF
jgi:hypothetical protein